MIKVLKQLKSLSHDSRFGGMDQTAKTASWARIAEAIGAETKSVAVATTVGGIDFEYLKWNFSQHISRPALAGAFSVVMVAGGWMTTVNAANSLPGDTLYSVKMITEKTQIKLASLDRKAVLHTEFAGRRLQEATDLQAVSTHDPESALLVHDTIEAYKQEVASAGLSLRQLKDEGSETTLATASSVQQNLRVADTAIDTVVAESDSVEATQEALAAKEVTNEVNQVATTVAVEVHEEQLTEMSAQELKQMFKSQLGLIEARQRFDIKRLDVIRLALANDSLVFTGLTVPTADELLSYEYPVVAIDSLLSQAMNNFAAGGFRTAFETLQTIEASLLEVESKLAPIEITIMDARAQTPVVDESEAIGTDVNESL